MSDPTRDWSEQAMGKAFDDMAEFLPGIHMPAGPWEHVDEVRCLAERERELHDVAKAALGVCAAYPSHYFSALRKALADAGYSVKSEP